MKVFLYILNFFLLVILGFRAVLLQIFSNTFHANILAIISLIVGILIGYFIAKKNDDVVEEGNDDEFEKYKLYAFCTVVGAIFTFILAFNLNYLLSFSSKRQELTHIVEVQPYIGSMGGVMKGDKLSPTGFNIWILKDGEKERIKTKSLENYNNLDGTDQVLTFRKGLLGFDCFLPE